MSSSGVAGDAELFYSGLERRPFHPQPRGHPAHPLPALESHRKFSSTQRGQSGILVDVHPGLLSGEIDRLAAINFPQVGLGEQPLDSLQLAYSY